MPRFLLSIIAAAVIWSALPSVTNASNITWEGSSSVNWEDAANWSLGRLPTSEDEVYFSGSNSCLITLPQTVRKITITSSFSKVITQEAPLYVRTDFIQEGGTFRSDPSQVFSVEADFKINNPSTGKFFRYTGTGLSSTESPYLVYDIYGIFAMQCYPDNHFKINNDIDASVTQKWIAGRTIFGSIIKGYYWRSSITFTGSLNGNGYEIRNLKLVRSLLRVLGTGAYVLDLGITGLTVNNSGYETIYGVLANTATGARIENCYVNCVNSDYTTAGMVSTALSGTRAINCYAYSDDGAFKGLFSSASIDSVIANSYHNGTDNGFGTKLSAVQFKQKASFSGWDFGNKWFIDEEISHPYLYNQLYSWKGAAGALWVNPGSWSKNSGYPYSKEHRVLINTSEAMTVQTPFSLTETMSLGGVQLGNENRSKLLVRLHMDLDDTGTKEGSLILYSGTFEVSRPDVRISVKGDFTKGDSADFIHGGSLFSFEGTGTSNVSGNIIFNDLHCTVPGKIIVMEPSSLVSIEGTFLLSGESDNPIGVAGTDRGGERWLISAESVDITDAVIADSHNIGPNINVPNAYDGGNNYGWTFGGYTVSVISNEGGNITPTAPFGEVLVPAGEPKTFTITADSGYYIGYVRIDGTFEASIPSNYGHSVTVPGDTGHHSVEAYFVKSGIKIWDGGGSNNSWNNAQNWTGDMLPSPYQSVIFSDISGKNCSQTSNVKVQSITIEASYSGTIFQSANLEITGNFEQYGGYFECNNPQTYSMLVGNDFVIPDTEGAFIRFKSTAGYYQIYDIYGLQAVRCNAGSDFKLMRNISADATRNWREGFRPIGAAGAEELNAPLSPFTGNFDGQNYVISGLNIISSDNFLALFGAVSNEAVITGVGLEDLSIFVRKKYNAYSCAGLVAWAADARISGCFAEGTITGDSVSEDGSSIQNVGGLTAYMQRSSVSDSYAHVDISGVNASFAGGLAGTGSLSEIHRSYWQGSISSEGNNIGGFVGYSWGNNIADCYSSGPVNGGPNSSYIGGFAGNISGVDSINNCYTTGTPEGVYYVGGFAGYLGLLGTVSSCLFTDSASDNGIADLVSSGALKNKATFPGWDFFDSWIMDEGISSPYHPFKVYNWTPREGNDWRTSSNWTYDLRRISSGYPGTDYEKVFIGTADSFSAPSDIAPLKLGGINLSSRFTNVLTLEADTEIVPPGSKGYEGSIFVAGGILDGRASFWGKTISVRGNIETSGEYSGRLRDVHLSLKGENSSIISGYFDIYALTIKPGSTKEVIFGSGTVCTLDSFTVSGETVYDTVVMKGSIPGSPWYIDSSNTDVRFAVVSDSHNIGTDIITAETSYDAGNNRRWDLGGYAVSAISGVGGYIYSSGVPQFENSQRYINVNEGGTVKISVTPRDGYYIGFVKIDGISTKESLDIPPKDFYLAPDGVRHVSIEAYFAPNGTRIWDGGGVSNYWSDPDNWTGNSSPEASDMAIFNSTNSKTCVIDAAAQMPIGSLLIESVSTVRIEQMSGLTMTGSYEQQAGTFISDTNYDFSIGATSNFYVAYTATFERFAGGDGSSSDPYLIKDVYGLQAINCTLDKYFKLTNDISAYGTAYWNWNGTTYEGFKPIGRSETNGVPITHPFSGGLDGDYYAVKGLHINLPSRNFTGFIGASTGNLRRIGLEDIYVSGNDYTGGLLGYSSAGDNLSECYVNAGSVTGAKYTGGLLGQGTISVSNSYSNAFVSGSQYVGGLAGGYNIVSDCYSSGEVHGNNNVGGFGGNGSSVTNSYSKANVYGIGTSPVNINGFAENSAYYCYASGTVSIELPYYAAIDEANGFGPAGDSTCYYTHQLYRAENAVRISAEQLKKKRTFSGWDFASKWTIDEDLSSPQLMWQINNWTGAADNSWSNASNWTKNLKKISSAPSGQDEKVYIGTGESFFTPASNTALGGLCLGSGYTGTLGLGGNLLILSADRDGSLIIAGGTLDASSSNFDIRIERDLIKYPSANFISREGMVLITNASIPSVFSGNIGFHNLRCESPGKRITFESSSSISIEGDFTIAGNSTDPVYLSGINSPSRWEIVQLSGARNLSYVAVKDSNNTGAVFEEPDCIDYGNNINWTFGSYLVQASSNEGGSLTPSGAIIVATGETVTFIATPESGYYLGFVRKDGRGTTEGTAYPYVATFEDVSAVHSIEVYFVRDGDSVWLGGTENGFWSEPENWTGNAVPGADTNVIFNDKGQTGSVIDPSFAGRIRSISIEASFAREDNEGVIVQSNDLEITGDYRQYGGIFYCPTPQTYSFSTGGDFRIPRSWQEGIFYRFTGDGTSDSTAWCVYDIYGLQGVPTGLSIEDPIYIKLMKDIDASPTRRWNWNGATCEGFVPIGKFTPYGSLFGDVFMGDFNGNGRIISDIYINVPAVDLDSEDIEDKNLSSGLFGVGVTLFSGGMIRNVGIRNGDIRGGAISGGVAGMLLGVVNNTFFTGYTSSESISGGLVGFLWGAVVDCYTSAEVSSAGRDFSSILESFFPAAGGLAGLSGGSIIASSHAYGVIDQSTSSYRGGLIGLSGGDSIINSYFADSSADNGIGTLKTRDEFKRESTFTAWNFDSVWSMDENINPPYLLFEIWNWDGATGTLDWNDPQNWTRKSGYPQLPTDKVYINYGDSVIRTPLSGPLTIGAIKLGSSFEGTLQLRNTLYVTPEMRSGEFAVLGGTVSPGDQTISLCGNFRVGGAGLFDSDSGVGAVVFADSTRPSLISGNATFYDLLCTTPGKLISFEAGSTHTIEGTFSISGEAGNNVKLRSSVEDSIWKIRPRSGKSVWFADVKDSSNEALSVINPRYTVNSGNNTNWWDSFSIRPTWEGSGSIIPGDEQPINHGGTVTFTISPEAFHRTAEFYVDGIPATPSNVFTFEDVSANHSLEAVFEPQYFIWTGVAGDRKWSTPGNWSWNVLPLATSEVIFNRYSGTDHSYADQDYHGSVGSILLDSGYGGIVYLHRTLTVETSVDIESGTFHASNESIFVGGNWTNRATFSRNSSSRIVFTDESRASLISGNNNFRNFTCRTPGKALTFEAGALISWEGTTNISGEAGRKITLRSSVQGEKWLVRPNANPARVVRFVDVSDSDNINDLYEMNALYSSDSGRNENWYFGYTMRAFANSLGTIEPAGIIPLQPGESITYTVTATPGAYIGYVRKDGVMTSEGLSSPHLVTFESIQTSHTIEVYFPLDGTRVWDGGLGTDESWSNGSNWTGDVVPTSEDTVIFSYAGQQDSTADTAFSGIVRNVSIESSYTGQITQSKALNISGYFSQSGGNYAQNAGLSVGGDFEQAGGAFTSETGSSFSVSGSFSLGYDGSFNRFTGSGLEGDPFVIYDIYGLQAVKTNRASAFRLNNDIDASLAASWNQDKGFSPIGTNSSTQWFTGKFDGGGFAVRNLSITRGEERYIGLFGYARGAEIQDLGLINATIVASDYAGSLTAVTQYGSVLRCYSKNGYVRALNVPSNGNVYTGGLIGWSSTGEVTDSYFTGTVEGYSLLGGLVARNYDSSVITNSYSVSDMVYVNQDNVGGLVGANSGIVTDSYYYSNRMAGAGTGKTSEEMKDRLTFSGWDFGRAWTIDQDRSYPQLIIENYVWSGGAGTGAWENPLNWNKRSGYPNSREHKAFINLAGDINTPSSDNPLVLGGLQIGPDHSGSIILSRNLNLDDSGTREGSLRIAGGTFDSNNQTINIHGDIVLASPGAFNRRDTSTVILTGEGVTKIEGGIHFANLRSVSPGKRITFESGSVQTVEADLVISGEPSSLIVLRASTQEAQWRINPKGSISVSNVDVSFAYNEGSSVINPAGSSLNSGNNTRWFRYVINTSFEGSGTIVPVGPYEILVTNDDPISFSIQPDIEYSIRDVKLDGASQGPVNSLIFSNVTSDHSIFAQFERMSTVTITATSGANGIISPSGNVQVLYGADQTFSFIPDAGYYISRLFVNETAQDISSSYTFTNVTTPQAVYVEFAQGGDYFITSEVSGNTGGTIEPIGIIGAVAGSSRTFNMYPDPGYYIGAVTVDAVSLPSQNSTYTFSDINSNHTISVVFNPIGGPAYTITAEYSGNGIISPEGTVGVLPGNDITFRMVPNTKNHLSKLYIDGGRSEVVSEYTFADVSGNHIISASFEPDYYVIDVSFGPNGTISPSGYVTAEVNTSKTFYINPDTGYRTYTLTVDDLPVVIMPQYTFYDITGAHSISATFTPDTVSITATAESGGSITPSGTIEVLYGGSQTFIISPEANYHTAGIIVNGVPDIIRSIYTFDNVTVDQTISVTFESDDAASHYITAEATGPGTISPSGIRGFAEGAYQSYIMLPDDNCHISSLEVDGISVPIVSIYDFEMIGADHLIRVEFRSNEGQAVYLITSEALGQGTISPSGNIGVISGASQSFISNPAAGSLLFDLKVDGVSVGKKSLYTFEDVQAGHTIQALFSGLPTPEAPAGLRVNMNGSNVVLTWRPVSGAENYYIYGSTDRFAPLSSWTTVKDGTTETEYIDTSRTGSVLEYYYIVKAQYAGGFSGPSSMGTYKKLVFVKNTVPLLGNLCRISLPYVSAYLSAESTVSSIDATMGNLKISSITKWMPNIQNVITYAYDEDGGWFGNNFQMVSGDGISVVTTNSFNWDVAGLDSQMQFSFIKNPGLLGSVYRISLPYTSVYTNAASLVESIDATFGNSKISSVTKWMPSIQNLVTYAYDEDGGWFGNNFLIYPGDGISIVVTSSFDWSPALVLPVIE